jgi:hypothetical protein
MNVDAKWASFRPPKLLVIRSMSMGAKYLCLMIFDVTLLLSTNFESGCQLHLFLASKIASVWKFDHVFKMPMLNKIWSCIISKHIHWNWVPIAPQYGLINCLWLKIWEWIQKINTYRSLKYQYFLANIMNLDAHCTSIWPHKMVLFENLRMVPKYIC